MKLEIIGADSAFNGLNTSFFFRDDANRGVLVDCGFTVFPELIRRDMAKDVDVVLISHMHADHTGSLCTLGVWMRTRQGRKIIVGGGMDIGELFRVQGVLPDDFIALPADDALNVKTIKTGHIPAYGYNNALFIADRILYSGDTNESVLDTEYARTAQIIIHETALSTPAVHTALELLNQAAPDIKAKTWLTHIPTSERPEIERLAAEMGFAGVCQNGQMIQV